jgi:superoxide dismutase, Fe-Mn family
MSQALTARFRYCRIVPDARTMQLDVTQMEELRMQTTKATTVFTLLKLPYGENALEPVISARTISFHYRKHHAGYVDTLNKLVEGTPLAGRPLEDIVLQAANDPKMATIFHNAAQVWNHNFYWLSMAAKGGGEPAGKLKHSIDSEFGSFKGFRDAFSKAAVGEFGSGWVWLTATREGKPEIAVTNNADTPLTDGKKPLITLDLWEHAYYLDFQNRRADYIASWFDKLVDWRFAEKNLG